MTDDKPAAGQIPNPNQSGKPNQGGQKRNIPNLYRFVDPEPPEGYKLNWRFLERRDSRQNIAITKSLKGRITQMAARYKLSQNSFINAVLNRFMDEVDRVDKSNGEYIPPRLPAKKRSEDA